ncbi:hypothetical protein LVD15_18265 [Fulvivirga maritima]|uniref:hypothetical protein n=1 Tax=Fulvivirga maritima TaxID=2904247 RepID=UPI001F3A06AA|nr:hypothetical protein [Fulvivirga maritima]UII25239.1 hypothetical protein LVD15_18265 [Fulvivirga maritima]
MKRNDNVIFLIDSQSYDRNIFSLTLERVTNCRVFNFFSFEETRLYDKLQPSLILHNSVGHTPAYYEGISSVNISNDLVKNRLTPAYFNNMIMYDIAQAVKKILK